MDKGKKQKYAQQGLWTFILLTVNVFATLFAVQANINLLLYACIIVSIVLAVVLLFIIYQANKALEKSEKELVRFLRRDESQLKKDKQSTDSHWQKAEAFRVDESLARIMPSAAAKFDGVNAYAETILQNMAKELDIVQGMVFVLNDADQMFNISGMYAYFSEERPKSFPLGETLSGQVAKNRQTLHLKEVPDGYVTVLSGLGKSSPRQLIITPILFNDQCIGIMEMASFKPFGENDELIIRKVCESMANQLNELRN